MVIPTEEEVRESFTVFEERRDKGKEVLSGRLLSDEGAFRSAFRMVSDQLVYEASREVHCLAACLRDQREVN